MTADRDVYPMPLFPQLTVSDVEASTAWYRGVGFDVVYSTPAMAHVRYRKYADVMLVSDREQRDETPAVDARGRGVTVYVTVEEESVDDVAARADELDAGASSGPHETAWNTREVVLEDPDGYELAFSEPVDAERAFDDVMDGASGNR